MTIQNQAINKLLNEYKLEEYYTINLGNANFYLKHGTNIIKYNMSPTLTTKNNIAVVVKED